MMKFSPFLMEPWVHVSGGEKQWVELEGLETGLKGIERKSD